MSRDYRKQLWVEVYVCSKSRGRNDHAAQEDADEAVSRFDNTFNPTRYGNNNS